MSTDNKTKLTPVFDNLEAALKVWWKNLKKFVFVYLWGFVYALVPMLVIGLIFGLKFWFGDRAGDAFYIAAFIITVISVLFLVYFAIRSYISIFLLVKDDYRGQELEIFKESKKYFWKYLGVVIPGTIFIMLWSLLLIIPGIIFAVFYSFAVFIFFFEGKEGLDAISASKKLVKGYWWPVFGRYLLIGLIALVFTIVITAPISAQGIDKSGDFYKGWNFFVQIINYLVGPIYLIYGYNIYQDLVKIKK